MNLDSVVRFAEKYGFRKHSQSTNGYRMYCAACGGVKPTFWIGEIGGEIVSKCHRSACAASKGRKGKVGILLHLGYTLERAQLEAGEELETFQAGKVFSFLHKKPENEVYDETILYMYEDVPQYLVDRGFHPDVIRHFEIGWDWSEYEVILPVRDHLGRLVGLTRRKPFATYDVKYRHDFLKDKTIYNLYRQEKNGTLIVHEGQLDVLRTHQNGVNNSVCVFNAVITVHQAQLLAEWSKKLILCFDGDLAGRHGALKSIENLNSIYYTNVRVVDLPEGLDPGEIQSNEELIGYLSNNISSLEFCRKYRSKTAKFGLTS